MHQNVTTFMARPVPTVTAAQFSAEEVKTIKATCKTVQKDKDRVTGKRAAVNDAYYHLVDAQKLYDAAQKQFWNVTGNTLLGRELKRQKKTEDEQD